MSKPCARCGRAEHQHYYGRYIPPGLVEQAVKCPHYVKPAPWWMRTLNKILGAFTRKES